MSAKSRRMIAGAVVAASLGAAALGSLMWMAHNEDANAGERMLSIDDIDLSPLDRVSEGTWRALATKRIYFGHQSVGSNILAGLQDIQQRKPQIRLNIIETRDPAQMTSPALAHSPIGRNQHPFEKIGDFASVLEGGMGQHADIALFKLCYVDFNEDSDVNALFRQYRDTMARLQPSLPNTTLIYVTSPLTTVQRGVKARVKALLGRNLWGYRENALREQFNHMVRQAAGTKPLLDLARIESHLPGGEAATFNHNGQAIPCLAEAYTPDGGHLNNAGRMLAARELLLTLAKIVERGNGAPPP